MDNYVSAEWLDAVRGKALFYPAAGCDWSEALDVFAGHIDEFWFADIAYHQGLSLKPVEGERSRFRLVSPGAISGDPNALRETRVSKEGCEYQYLEPSRLRETYERIEDKRRVEVIRRRGFGQIALSKEFEDCSIGVFMHRGDSPGERGSNTYYLGYMDSRYEPLRNLFEKLSRKLADRALIVSDGSNCKIRRIKRWHNKSTIGLDAFCEAQAKSFDYGDWRWQCVGYLNRRYGPTLVWGVERQRD